MGKHAFSTGMRGSSSSQHLGRKLDVTTGLHLCACNPSLREERQAGPESRLVSLPSQSGGELLVQ